MHFFMEAVNTFYVYALPLRSAVLLTLVICGKCLSWLTEPSSGANLSARSDTHLSVQVSPAEEQLMLDTVSDVRTTALPTKTSRLSALISGVWDAPGCHSASTSCSWRIMVMPLLFNRAYCVVGSAYI